MPAEWALLSDGEGVLPHELMFAGRRGDPIAVPWGCLLVRGSGPVTLVDAGLGDYPHLGGSGGQLTTALAAEGVAPEDVELVLITHAHIDHIGGLCANGVPRFAAARHVMSRVERASRDDRVADEQLVPLERADLLEIGDDALFLGDAIVDPRHVEDPEWTLAVDDDPALNVATRRDLLDDAATTGKVIAASHLRAAGTVERVDGAFRLYSLPAKA